jgi:hypothetical protein
VKWRQLLQHDLTSPKAVRELEARFCATAVCLPLWTTAHPPHRDHYASHTL